MTGKVDTGISCYCHRMKMSKNLVLCLLKEIINDNYEEGM